MHNKPLKKTLHQLSRNALTYCTELLKMPVRIRRLAIELSRMQEQLKMIQLQQCTVSDEVSCYSNCRRYSSALMTVMIIPENVIFLEEWISHHLNIGVDHIVVYDNSKSRYNDHWEQGGRLMGFDGTTTNKHHVDYSAAYKKKYGSVSPIEVFQEVLKKFPGAVSVVEWARKDSEGRVCYFQLPAIKDFIFRNRQNFDYMFAMDADEFLHSDCGWRPADLFQHMEQSGITSALLGQRRYLYRFASLDTPVRDISWAYREDYPAFNFTHCKTALRLKCFVDFHAELITPHTIPTAGYMKRIDPKLMRFHHYQVPIARGKFSMSEFTNEDWIELQTNFVNISDSTSGP